ncbi:MAG: biopolymer transporter ExbD [Tannerella sp.]|jgi:biopolymer transport protein ExbD|nr:biopolymer transporter ExbD [Tannerella sp.]
MSEIQTKDAGGGGKNKQKKQTLRVDFTPMVDMNMLLITFFMLCTSLVKPQTMNINMPSKDIVDDSQKEKVRESGAVTIILGGDNKLYYYEGMPKEDGSSYADSSFLQLTPYGAEGIRTVLLRKNSGTYELIQELKDKKQKLEITEEQFREESKKIQEEALNVKKIAPTIMIKPTDLSTYKNLVDVLDEMLICNIGAYAIIELSEGDRYLLFKKTDNPEYLTEKQRAEATK